MKQGFQIYNSFMRGYIDPATESTKASLDDFFAKSNGFAKLVFAKGANE